VSTIHANSATSASPESLPEEDSVVWSIFDAMPAWGMSLLVHIGIIIIVAMISLPEIALPEFNLTSTVEMEEIQQVEYVLDTEPSESLGTKSDLNIASPSAAVAQNRGLAGGSLCRVSQDFGGQGSDTVARLRA